MKRSDFRLLDRLRVRWAEVDMQKIVFNGHYLMYFDTAVAAYWRALAMPYESTLAQWQGDLFVRKATVEYEGSARYDDLCEVGIRCARVGNTSIRFDAALFRGEQRLVHGELIYVFADAVSLDPRPVPDALRQALQAFEAGQPMAEVQVGDWARLGPAARSIRHAVFVQEQGIPAALEQDAADFGAVHAVATNRLGQPLATGRLLQRSPGVAQVGRLAVLQAVRGSQLGRQVLQALIEAARERGDHELMLHSQSSATGFYLAQGFRQRGPAFEEAGIEHVELFLVL